PADGVVNDVFKIDPPHDLSQVHFIKLLLKNEQGEIVATSFYWESNDLYQGAWTMTGPAVSGFEDINQLDKIKLNTKVHMEGEVITVNVTNPTQTLSFFTQVKLQNEQGIGIKPAFYSDNFFCLLPGESKTITISFLEATVPQMHMQVITDGFNVVK